MECESCNNSTGENIRKICICQNFVVSLHLISFRDCLLVHGISKTSSAGKRGRFFCAFFCFCVAKMIKNQKKTKKNKKKSKKICIYQKKVLPLHQISKQGDRKHQKRNKKSY